jgi:hypothetical protein
MKFNSDHIRCLTFRLSNKNILLIFTLINIGKTVCFFNHNQFHLFGYKNLVFINPYKTYKYSDCLTKSYFNKRVTYNIVIQNLGSYFFDQYF